LDLKKKKESAQQQKQVIWGKFCRRGRDEFITKKKKDWLNLWAEDRPGKGQATKVHWSLPKRIGGGK